MICYLSLAIAEKDRENRGQEVLSRGYASATWSNVTSLSEAQDQASVV